MPPESTRFHGRVALIAVLVFASVAVYLPVRDFDFVNYDDNDYVYANPNVIRGLTIDGWRAAWLDTRVGHWLPLASISHMLDVELFGLDAGRHHLVNLAFHVVNVTLLFLVLSAMTGAPWRSAIVAGLFALHPLNVESVAWITQRKNLLSTTMWLISIAAYFRWVRDRRMINYLFVAAAFIAGLMSKAMVITLPATLLLLDVWPLRRIDHTMLTAKPKRNDLARIILEKTPLFAISLVAALTTYATQRAAGAIGERSFPFVERLLNASVSSIWYIRKSIVPTALCVINPHPASVGEIVSRPLALLSIALLGALAFISIRSFKRAPWVFVGLCWYGVTLLPVTGIIQIGSNAYGDHFAYVPLIGVFVAAVWSLAEFCRTAAQARTAFVAGTVLITLLGVGARAQLSTWRNSETLYKRAIAVYGGTNAIAQKNLAAHYSDLGRAQKAAGRPDLALTYFRAASALHVEPGILYNEAVALSDLHRYREAIPLYDRSLELDAANADGWLNLGDAQVMSMNYVAAIHAYKRALTLRKDKFADYGLAYACAHVGDAACASTAFARLEAVDPQLASDLGTQLQAGR